MPESGEPCLRQTGLARLSRKTTGHGGPTILKSDLQRRRYLKAGGRNSSWQKSPIKQVSESRNENKKDGHKTDVSGFCC
jgi:hypothetical protein